MPALSQVMRWFKTLTTNEYLRRFKQEGWPRLAGKLWQRNYYEHIIRHPDALQKIRRYIAENPTKWAFDVENPARTTTVRDEILDIIEADTET